MLEIQNLVKTFQQGEAAIQVLKNLNLSIQAGESVALLGRSGSGKSTLLTLLAGLDRPTEGRLLWKGRSYDSFPESEFQKLRTHSMGMIFQQFHLLPHLTAYENVRLPLDLHNESNAHERTMEALSSLGLSHRAKHRPSELSRGECQRVAIGRTLVMKPELILADEPTASLDDWTSQQIMTLFFDLLASANIALLIATHDLDVAERCQKRLRLKDGELRAEA